MRRKIAFHVLVSCAMVLLHGSSCEHIISRQSRDIPRMNEMSSTKRFAYETEYQGELEEDSFGENRQEFRMNERNRQSFRMGDNRETRRNFNIDDVRRRQARDVNGNAIRREYRLNERRIDNNNRRVIRNNRITRRDVMDERIVLADRQKKIVRGRELPSLPVNGREGRRRDTRADRTLPEHRQLSERRMILDRRSERASVNERQQRSDRINHRHELRSDQSNRNQRFEDENVSRRRINQHVSRDTSEKRFDRHRDLNRRVQQRETDIDYRRDSKRGNKRVTEMEFKNEADRRSRRSDSERSTRNFDFRTEDGFRARTNNREGRDRNMRFEKRRLARNNNDIARRINSDVRYRTDDMRINENMQRERRVIDGRNVQNREMTSPDIRFNQRESPVRENRIERRQSDYSVRESHNRRVRSLTRRSERSDENLSDIPIDEIRLVENRRMRESRRYNNRIDSNRRRVRSNSHQRDIETALSDNHLLINTFIDKTRLSRENDDVSFKLSPVTMKTRVNERRDSSEIGDEREKRRHARVTGDRRNLGLNRCYNRRSQRRDFRDLRTRKTQDKVEIREIRYDVRRGVPMKTSDNIRSNIRGSRSEERVREVRDFRRSLSHEAEERITDKRFQATSLEQVADERIRNSKSRIDDKARDRMNRRMVTKTREEILYVGITKREMRTEDNFRYTRRNARHERRNSRIESINRVGDKKYLNSRETRDDLTGSRRHRDLRLDLKAEERRNDIHRVNRGRRVDDQARDSIGRRVNTRSKQRRDMHLIENQQSTENPMKSWTAGITENNFNRFKEGLVTLDYNVKKDYDVWSFARSLAFGAIGLMGLRAMKTI